VFGLNRRHDDGRFPSEKVDFLKFLEPWLNRQLAGRGG
jgi:hypothetical protein